MNSKVGRLTMVFIMLLLVFIFFIGTIKQKKNEDANTSLEVEQNEIIEDEKKPSEKDGKESADLPKDEHENSSESTVTDLLEEIISPEIYYLELIGEEKYKESIAIVNEFIESFYPNELNTNDWISYMKDPEEIDVVELEEQIRSISDIQVIPTLSDDDITFDVRVDYTLDNNDLIITDFLVVKVDLDTNKITEFIR